MTYAEIGDMTFPQLENQLKPKHSEYDADASDRKAVKGRFGVFQQICEKHNVEPTMLARMDVKDVTAWIREVWPERIEGGIVRNPIDLTLLPSRIKEFVSSK